MDEKSAIFEIIIASKKLNINNTEEIKKLAEKCWEIKEFCKTEFGCRFIKRLSEIFKGNTNDECILCGNNMADNKIVCSLCYENLSEQAKKYTPLIMFDKVENQKNIANEDILSLKNDLKEQMHRQSIASDKYTENLIRNLDASMDRLASRKSIKVNNKMLTAVMVISLINTIGIVSIILMLLK